MKKASVLQIRNLNSKMAEIVFRPEDPDVFEFEAGQYIALSTSQDDLSQKSYFSLASDDKNKEKFTLLIRLIPGTQTQGFFSNLSLGDIVTFEGPGGNVRFCPSTAGTSYFFSTGSGFAPHYSLITSNIDSTEMPFEAHIGVENEKDTFYVEELQSLNQRYNRFQYDFHFSDKDGFIMERFKNMPVKSEDTIYLCGQPEMVTEMTNLALSKGIGESNIIKESY